MARMIIEGPITAIETDCERVLRTLPRWFGIEESLLEYARATSKHPTFVARMDGSIVGFLTLCEHFPEAWEVHCVAVDAAHRSGGIGRRLQERAESWLIDRGAVLLQVKTLAASHPSPEYAETRRFYERLGFVPLEVFPHLWAEHLPVLVLVKSLRPVG